MVPGSLSSALQTMYFWGGALLETDFGERDALRTSSHLLPVGNPAPPMPRSPLALSAAKTPCQSRVSTKLRTTE